MWSHTVPKRLLKQFAYDDPITRSPRLWRYTKGNPPFPGIAPKNATSVDGYFADPHNAALEHLVETRLANEIEDPVNKFLPKFSDVGWAMSDLQRRQMTRYITLLFGRCMARRAAEKHLQDIKIYALNKFLGNQSQLLTVTAHWNINAYSRGLRFTVNDVAMCAKQLAASIRSKSAAQQA